ncbi:MAG: hypothetical protein Q9204_002662 [Flavoplaca sp. TL-2023a]
MANECASCGQVGLLVCNGCGNTPAYLDDAPSATRYCGPACQKSHWTQHKDRCQILQRRKILHRAAKVIQALYYILCRKSMRLPVEKVDRADEHTVLVHIMNPDISGRNLIFQDINRALVSAADQLVALTMHGCTTSTITMGQSVQIMLKDVIPLVYESSVVALNRKLWVETVLPSGSLTLDHEISKVDYVNQVDRHEVFFVMMLSPGVVLQDQERYAIDLTHVQYGHHDETLMPWKTFVETRTLETSEILPLGRARLKAEEVMVKTLGEEGRMIQSAVAEFAEVMTAAVREYPGWMKVWKEQDESRYQRHVERIYQHVTKRLDQFIATKMNHRDFQIWHSMTEKKLMQGAVKQMRKEKIKTWGVDLRGPAFAPAMKLMKARQKKERSKWGTPEDEKKKMHIRALHAFEGTDYKGETPDISELKI